MDKLAECDRIVESILQARANLNYKQKDIHGQVFVDAERRNFLLMNIGWDGHRRIHTCMAHIEIIDGKIWIQRDGFEDSITEELEAAGIPTDRIVLAFYPPHVRPHTGYAVA